MKTGDSHSYQFSEMVKLAKKNANQSYYRHTGQFKMNALFYVLRDREPVKVDSVEQWAREFEKSDWKVAETKLPGVQVSTVFLGFGHAFAGGPPLLFETMIFGGKHDEYQARYSTWEEAEKGHEIALKLVGDGE